MDAARRTGDIGVPPLQMARNMLSWRVPPVAQVRHADVHFLRRDTPIKPIPPLKIAGHEACRQ